MKKKAAYVIIVKKEKNMTTKQRATLRAYAQKLEPTFRIGKNGVGENLLADISNALDMHELVKIAVLKNCDLDAKSAMEIVCESLNAEPVGAIGGKFSIYRKSSKEDVEHIEF